jgi:predicted nucleic acid-binding protein
MTRFVIDAQTALDLAARRATIPVKHRLLAPTLLRSQVLSCLYSAVRKGDIDRTEANLRLDYLRKLNIRLLGDRTLQRTAWKIADQLGWTDTFVAEYVALTQLQADVFVTADTALADVLRGVVVVMTMSALLAD